MVFCTYPVGYNGFCSCGDYVSGECKRRYYCDKFDLIYYSCMYMSDGQYSIFDESGDSCAVLPSP